MIKVGREIGGEYLGVSHLFFVNINDCHEKQSQPCRTLTVCVFLACVGKKLACSTHPYVRRFGAVLPAPKSERAAQRGPKFLGKENLAQILEAAKRDSGGGKRWFLLFSGCGLISAALLRVYWARFRPNLCHFLVMCDRCAFGHPVWCSCCSWETQNKFSDSWDWFALKLNEN